HLDQSGDTPIDTFGGGNMIADYKGELVGRHLHSGSSAYVGRTIDIGALRDFRARALGGNWTNDRMTGPYQLICDRPMYPKTLCLDRAPMKHAEYRREVIDKQIALMHDRGVWKKPGRST